MGDEIVLKEQVIIENLIYEVRSTRVTLDSDVSINKPL